jgi:hypothetical protein
VRSPPARRAPPAGPASRGAGARSMCAANARSSSHDAET